MSQACLLILQCILTLMHSHPFLFICLSLSSVFEQFFHWMLQPDYFSWNWFLHTHITGLLSPDLERSCAYTKVIGSSFIVINLQLCIVNQNIWQTQPFHSLINITTKFWSPLTDDLSSKFVIFLSHFVGRRHRHKEPTLEIFLSLQPVAC